MFEVIGDSGPAVLLIPGGAEAVDGFFPGLAEGLMADPGCRVILVDRPGAGDSTVEGGLADAAASLHATIVDAGAGPVVVIGQSLGGAVALLLATTYPDDVAGVVLLDATPINDPKLARMVAQRMRTMERLFRVPVVRGILSSLLRSSAKKSVRQHAMSDEYAAATHRIASGIDIPKLGRAVVGMEDLADEFDATRLPQVPAVVITADRPLDDPLRRAHARAAEALGAPLLSWPKAEHQVHLTHPAEVLDASREVVRAAAAD